MKTDTLLSVFSYGCQSDWLPATWRLFAWASSPSLPFPIPRTALDFVCQARLAKGKYTYK